LGFSVVQTLLLLLVLLMYAGLQGVMFVTLITTCCFGLLGLFFVREWLVYPSDLRHVKEIMPFAWPYGVICMMAAFLPTMERSITNLLLGANELGLYAAATKIAMLIGVLIIAFQTAWGPFYLSLHKKSDAFFTYNWVLKLFSIGICVFTLVLTLLAQPIILILASDRYSGAVIAVFPLIMGLAIQGTSWITEIGIGISKKSHLSLYSYAISLIVSFGSIILLASNFGILGISIGVLLGHISKAYTSYLLAQRAYPLPWPYVSVLTIFLFTLFSGFLAIGIGHYLGEWPYLLTLVVAILVVVFAGWRILFDQADRDYLVKIIRRKVFMNDKLGGI
jgi:O-antigen/teichoic acid export membrane protein